MTLIDALSEVDTIPGWDWSRCRTRMGQLGWSYIELLRDYLAEGMRALDVGTGGGEVFSSVARASDIAVDLSPEMLKVARERLPCPVVAADGDKLPFLDSVLDIVSNRHVGVDPHEVLRVLRHGGLYVTQQVGGRVCQSIFDAFGWGSNGDFWRREATARGSRLWDVEAIADVAAAAGCTILRREEANVDYEFLDEESLAFWLMNAPLPEQIDPDH